MGTSIPVFDFIAQSVFTLSSDKGCKHTRSHISGYLFEILFYVFPRLSYVEIYENTKFKIFINVVLNI